MQAGLELSFLGGKLCSGCSLVGNGDGIMYSIKHNAYLQVRMGTLYTVHIST